MKVDLNVDLGIVEKSKEARRGLNEAGFPEAEVHLNEWSYLPAEGWKFNCFELVEK